MIDLFNIHKSKLKRDLFELYFANLDGEFYIRELARILNRPAGYVRRELMALESSGLFVSEIKGKQKYFRLNKKYPLFKEVKEIISKTIGVEKTLKDVISKTPGIKVAFVFGSFAEGKEDLLSDIDLMIVGSPDEDLLIEKVSKIETSINREINYHIYSTEDIKEKIKEKDSFIENVVSAKKIYLKSSENELQRLCC